MMAYNDMMKGFDDLDKIIVVTVIAFFLFFCVLVGVSAVDIQPGETLNFSYVNVSNQTVSVGFVCLENSSFCSQENLSVTVFPGETITASQGFCSVTASCTNSTTSSSSCSIDRDLEPGETYQNHNGACDVRFECEDTLQVCENVSGSVRQSRLVRFESTAGEDTIRFSFEGEPNQTFKKNGSIYHEFSVDYSCPVDVSPSQLSSDQLIRLCQETNPFILGSLQLALDRGFSAVDEKQSCEDERISVRETCELQKTELNERISSCNAERDALKSQWQLCQDEKADLSNGNGWRTAIIIMLFMWAVGASLLALIAGILWFKNRSSNEVTQ